jgi:probable HAF family extracellular repeat protein
MFLKKSIQKNPPNGLMHNLGSLGGGFSCARAVSADGAVAAGVASNSTEHHAFVWTKASGMVDLEVCGGFCSEAYGISQDGSVIVGKRKLANDTRTHGYNAFRWTSFDGIIELDSLEGGHSVASCVSSDGTVIAGWSRLQDDSYRAVRWTSRNGIESLGNISGIKNSYLATSISGDGSTIVGNVHNEDGGSSAFIWTKDTGMRLLNGIGTEHEFVSASSAYGISKDGSVIVGGFSAIREHDSSRKWISQRAYCWNAKRGAIDLGCIPRNSPVSPRAHAVSGDGLVVVGNGSTSLYPIGIYAEFGTGHTFYWKEATGMHKIANTLGGNYSKPYSLSHDGSVLVGCAEVAKNPSRWAAFRWSSL